MKWGYIAYGLAWISTAIAVSVGLYYTKEATCLWGFVFPLFISLEYHK